MHVLVDDVHLFFDVDGCGLVAHDDVMAVRPTVVLLHGGPGADHSLFKPEFSAIADAAQVIYLDQRGSGRSDRSVPSMWTWQRWADDVAAFCQAIGVTRPVLIGSSSGGMVAMMCAKRHPDLVAALVLDSTFGAPITLDESLAVFERRGGPVARDAAARYLGGDTSADAADAWKQHGLPLYGVTTDDGMAVRLARAEINNDVQAHFRRGGCGPQDITTYAGRIGCPTLILAGEDDPVVPAAAQRRLGTSMTDAAVRVEIFAGVGHSVFRQAGQPAFDLLRSFLSGRADQLVEAGQLLGRE